MGKADFQQFLNESAFPSAEKCREPSFLVGKPFRMDPKIQSSQVGPGCAEPRVTSLSSLVLCTRAQIGKQWAFLRAPGRSAPGSAIAGQVLRSLHASGARPPSPFPTPKRKWQCLLYAGARRRLPSCRPEPQAGVQSSLSSSAVISRNGRPCITGPDAGLS